MVKLIVLGWIDERNTFQHCSQSSMLGSNFLCSSTNTCIPYNLLCVDEHRCPNRSDDELWCSRRASSGNCSDPDNFACFDGQCFKGSRCNRLRCPFAEDEYMCNFRLLHKGAATPYRHDKEVVQRSKQHSIRSPLYPSTANITDLTTNAVLIQPPPMTISSNTSSFSSYWCNRGLGILLRDDSIVCFCPPQYYGDKCEYHADRLSVLLRLNLSQSIYTSGSNSFKPLKLIVLFLFNNQTLNVNQFNLYPSADITAQKMITHFPYSHSASSRAQRKQRFFDRSDILNRQPYSIRIELYQAATITGELSLIAVWKYPLYFDHLPVYRLAKILQLSESADQKNPCSSHPCRRNEQCQQLMYNKYQYICLCPANFSGDDCPSKDQHCLKGHCAPGSSCHPSSRVSLRRDALPYCLCPLNRCGDRCSIEQDRCLSNPCGNDGSCIPSSQSDQVICACTEGFTGPRCQLRRPSIRLSLSSKLSHQAAVTQFLQIDFTSLALILVDQRVYPRLPQQIVYYHRDERTSIPHISLVKLYSSFKDSLPELYLLSVQLNVFSIIGRTEISEANRCSHVRTFSNGKSHNFKYPLVGFHFSVYC